MNITVYLGSVQGNRDIYRKLAVELGTWIGENGHTLVYGGSGVGLMGVLLKASYDAGAYTIGVEPKVFLDQGLTSPYVKELIEVEDFPSRRMKMIELGDVFIAMPGGTGTLDEISEVMCYLRLGMLDQPCILLNTDGFYEGLKTQLDMMVKEGFLDGKARERITFVKDIEELKRVLDRNS